MCNTDTAQTGGRQRKREKHAAPTRPSLPPAANSLSLSLPFRAPLILVHRTASRPSSFTTSIASSPTAPSTISLPHHDETLPARCGVIAHTRVIHNQFEHLGVETLSRVPLMIFSSFTSGTKTFFGSSSSSQIFLSSCTHPLLLNLVLLRHKLLAFTTLLVDIRTPSGTRACPGRQPYQAVGRCLGAKALFRGGTRGVWQFHQLLEFSSF